MLKKQILSILMSVSLLSNIGAMTPIVDLQKCTKRTLIRRVGELEQGKLEELNPHVLVEANIVQPIVEVAFEDKAPSFFSRNKGKLLLLSLASAGTAGYYFFPEEYRSVFDMARILIESRFIPESNVSICKIAERAGFLSRLLHGKEELVCKLARNMSFKEIFSAFFRK